MTDMDDTEIEIPSPRENPALQGHEDAERELQSAAGGGRLPHAWLITGPQGIGKATLAYRFARYLFTHPPASDDGPGLFGEMPVALPEDGEGLFVDPELPVFHRVAASGHGDLFTLECRENDNGKMSTQIRVDDVRAAIDFARKTSSEGGYKVIVVDGAEFLNRSSENAFLKILEEPPPHTVILLVSHNPGRLLPTTRSRCRTLALKPLAADIITDLMRTYRPDLAPDEAAELARLSGGSIGRAMMMASADGLRIYRDIVAILAALPRIDGRAVQGFATAMAKAGADDTYRVGLDLYRWWLSRIVLASSRGAEGDPTLTAEERAIAARAADTAILPIWLRRLDETESLIRSAEPLNLDRKQVMQSLFFSLA